MTTRVTQIQWRRNAIRTTRSQRVCEAVGCSTILSKYNPRRKCSVHERVA